MAINYSTAVKTARMAAVIAQIDAGSGPGTLEICTTAYGTVLATLTLADPCGTASGGVLTFDFDPDISATATATGTAAIARIKDSTGTVCVDGLTTTLSGGGGDIILDSLSITSGQTVTVTTGTFTHA